MAKISEKTIENLEEMFSRGCEYAATQDEAHDTFTESMNALGGVGDWDEMGTEDLYGKEILLQDLFETFYDKMIEKVLNVLRTEE